MQERRRYPRIKCRHKIGVKLSSEQVVKTWSCDVSLGGIQILTDYNADKGDIFQLQLKVPASNPDNSVAIECRGRVAYVALDSSASQYRIGFQIIGFKGNGEEHYRRFVDQLIRRLYSRQ
jgi:c-di-GMP-binding flagellar brake protein YcgR